MTGRIKVLQLQNNYNVSASDLAEQIIQGLPAERYEVTAAFLSGRPAAGEPPSRAARSVYFGFGPGETKGLRLRAQRAVYKLCKEARYDVVIAHRFKPISMLMLLNRWLRIPACIGVLHGLGEYDRAYRRWLLRRLLTPAWRLVGVSRAVRDDLLNCGAGLAPDAVRQINNAIDIGRVEAIQHSRAEARRLLDLPPDAFVFGAIGRLVPVKGHLDLIDAFARLKDENPRAMVAIIGEGRSRGELEEAIARRQLQGRVRLLGAKNDAAQFVRAFDVFVMPSLSEGLPLALLEAMSGRLPVIGSDIASMRSILEDGEARIFPVGVPEKLAGRLRETLALTPEQRAAEGERTYAYLCRAHAIGDFRRHYRELIEELLAGSGRHG